MIRGAIEVANRSIVSGWLYSKAVELRGQLVLAFIGNRHVGTGKVELFRKDIKEAGLGDGYAGFYFPLTLLPTDQPEAVTIRLDESDLALLQAGSLVSQPPRRPVSPSVSVPPQPAPARPALDAAASPRPAAAPSAAPRPAAADGAARPPNPAHPAPRTPAPTTR